jgi:hypothetical protein
MVIVVAIDVVPVSVVGSENASAVTNDMVSTA